MPAKLTEDSPLTNLQKAFVEQLFIQNFNATEAAAQAGYSGSRATLAQTASDNLKKPHIAKRVRERLDELAMQANEVLWRISEQATANMGDFLQLDVDEEGEPTGDFRLNLARAQAAGKLRLVKKLKITDKILDRDGNETLLGRTYELELHDAQRALEILAKHHGLLDATGRRDDPIHVNIPQLDAIFERIYGEQDRPEIIDVTPPRQLSDGQ